MKTIELTDIQLNIILEALNHRANEAYENKETKTMELAEETIMTIREQAK